MSLKAMGWVLEHSPVENRGDLLVLIVLADHAHDDGGGAYPSVDSLARKARLSRRGVFDSLARLKGSGAIVAEGRGRGNTVSYRLVMQEPLSTLDAPVAVQALHGAGPAPVQLEASKGADTCTQTILNHPTAVESPGRARDAQRTSPTPDQQLNGVDVVDEILGVLLRGIDSLTSDDRQRRPTLASVTAVLGRHPCSAIVARAIAIETRSIAQSQNRAPNITALYEQRLSLAVGDEAAA